MPGLSRYTCAAALVALALGGGASSAQDIWGQAPPPKPEPAKIEQFKHLDGSTFDAYKSQAKQYDTFSAFLEAQSKLVARYLEQGDKVAETEDKVLRLQDAILPPYQAFRTKDEALVTIFQTEQALRETLAGDRHIPSGELLELFARSAGSNAKITAGAKELADARSMLLGAINAWNTARTELYYDGRALARIESDFLGNLFFNEAYHRPASVAEVRVTGRFGDIYYAKLEPDQIFKNLEVELAMAHVTIDKLEAVAQQLVEVRPILREDLARIESEWHEMNAHSHDLVVRQLWLDGFLELGDVAVSAREAGPAWPAVILWEAGYRSWDPIASQLSGKPLERKVSYPKLSANVIRIRQEIAEGEATGTPADQPILGAAEDVVNTGLLGVDRVSSAIPGDFKEQAAVALFDLARDLGSARKVVEYAEKYDPVVFVQRMGRKALLKGPPRAVTDLDMLFAADGKTLKSAIWSRMDLPAIKSAGKGFLFDIGLNTIKAEALAAADLVRVNHERDMAMKEIEYLTIRNSLSGIFLELMRLQDMLRTTVSAFGKRRQDVESICCYRNKEINEELGPNVTALEDDYDENDTVTLEVVFDKPVPLPEYQIGAGTAFEIFTSSDPREDGRLAWVVTVPITALNGDGETLPLSIRVSATKPVRFSLDGSAGTVPTLDSVQISAPVTRWTKVGPGIDTLHELPVVSPETGFYLAVADILNSEGLGMRAAGGLGISVLDEDGEVVAIAETGDTIQPVFVKVKPGTYTVRLDIMGYFPVYDQSCGNIYERKIVVEKSHKPGFTAIVRSAQQGESTMTLGIASGECIASKKN